jgi:hypothetical protein
VLDTLTIACTGLRSDRRQERGIPPSARLLRVVLQREQEGHEERGRRASDHGHGVACLASRQEQEHKSLMCEGGDQVLDQVLGCV